MKLNELSKSNLIVLGVLILFACVGVYEISYKLGGKVGKELKRNDQIAKVLEDRCDCKAIEQSVYLSGIQFGKDGVSRERGEYQLIDCNYESLDQEKERILTVLKKEVKHFEELDHLELEFINNNVSQIVIIKNGKIQ